jgi:universal bacterial protein YeaZ
MYICACMPDQIILQIETATQVCAVALSINGVTIASLEVDEPNVHASRLTLLVEEMLLKQGLSFGELAAIAVSMGPGSYTGLRIGVSTAKGFCYATGLPLIGINTLTAMAAGFEMRHPGLLTENTLLCPMVDARRMEVYSAIYDSRRQPVSAPAANIINVETFQDLAADRQIVLFGSGADKFAQIFAGHSRVKVITGFKNSARFLSQLAFEALTRGEFADVAYFEPYYLKDFIPTTPKPITNPFA